MSRWNTAGGFVRALASTHIPDVFNPYSDICSVHDLPNAPAIRRKNLELILGAALDGGADTIWVAQDLGRRGGRRTGLALTDEASLGVNAARWGVEGVEKATHGPIVREATAGYAWRALANENARVFLWNVFPFHSHPPDAPLLNRGHTREEAVVAVPFMCWLLEALRPRAVVALGRLAEKALLKQGVDCNCVRHPGRGGGARFLEEVAALRD